MNEIKVTVEYEIPKTNKMDELFKKYDEAKQVSDEMISYYKPLADMAEEAKFDAILDQLEVIKGYVKRIGEIKKCDYAIRVNFGTGPYLPYGHPLKVTYRKSLDKVFCSWDSYEIGKEHFLNCRQVFTRGDMNLLGKWDEWQAYTKLEEACQKAMLNVIEDVKHKAEVQKSRLENIVG